MHQWRKHLLGAFVLLVRLVVPTSTALVLPGEWQAPRRCPFGCTTTSWWVPQMGTLHTTGTLVEDRVPLEGTAARVTQA
jgi:hypothetical protein